MNEKMREKIEEIVYAVQDHGYSLGSGHTFDPNDLEPDIAVQKILALNASENEKIAKAYGGCEKCYGKGYSTQMLGEKVNGDFIGDKSYEVKPYPQMIFCDCERGKQLKKYVVSEKLALLEEMVQEPFRADDSLRYREGYDDAVRKFNAHLEKLKESLK